MRDRTVLIGVCGSIAAYKSCEVVRACVKQGADVRVIMTLAATAFVGPATLAALSGHPVHTMTSAEPERVIHVELGRWADAFAVVGATASTLRRIANGDASDLVSATWLMSRCPTVIAPAMHTEMWEHAAVQRNVTQLRADGARFVGPVAGDLASGDHGMGRLAEPSHIVEAIAGALTADDLSGVRVLVTAGPTREPIDPVRFISNRSSGRMGFALAAEARRRGADVTVVAGPTTAPPPWGVEVIDVETAAEMLRATRDAASDADIVILNAAVADWTPARPADHKARKAEIGDAMSLTPTEDIAAVLGREKGDRIHVAFAAETDDLVSSARAKLGSKNADLVVANLVAQPGTGFDTLTNDAVIVSPDGEEHLPRLPKPELARRIWDRIVKLRVERDH